MTDNPKPRGRPKMTAQDRHQKHSEAIQFGSKVAHFRRKADLSQEQAAQRCPGLSTPSWTAMEGGRSNPLAAYQVSLARLQAIASTIGVTLDDLIDPLQ